MFHLQVVAFLVGFYEDLHPIRALTVVLAALSGLVGGIVAWRDREAQ
jgi:hypothetical protein